MQRISTSLTLVVAVAATALSAAPAARAAPATLDDLAMRQGTADATGRADLRKAPARAEQIGRRRRARAPRQRASYTRASCADRAGMTGTWLNYGSPSRAVTRVVVRVACGDEVHCDGDGFCWTGYSGYIVEVFGAEGESWGRQTVTPMAGGWYRALYLRDGTKDVWLGVNSTTGRTFLRTVVYNDFPAWDPRPDFTSDEWFLR